VSNAIATSKDSPYLASIALVNPSCSSWLKFSSPGKYMQSSWPGTVEPAGNEDGDIHPAPRLMLCLIVNVRG
jgi:hypothetical protein